MATMLIESNGFTIDYGNGCKLTSSENGTYVTKDNGEHWADFLDYIFNGELDSAKSDIANELDNIGVEVNVAEEFEPQLPYVEYTEI